MRVRVGVGIGAESVRVLLVNRAGAVHWHDEVPREAPGAEGLAIALRNAFARIPGRRWPRRRAVAALGPHCTQVRLLSELPPLGKAADIARAVHENAHRFFLRNGVPLSTGGVRVVDDRRSWAAAFERPSVDTVIACCRQAGLRLVAIVPTAAVLHAGIASDHVSWVDGTACTDLSVDASGLLTVARHRSTVTTARKSELIQPSGPLAMLGEDGWRFADAFGAVMTGVREPLRLQGSALHERELRTSTWRRVASYTVATAALLVALLAPGLRAWRAEVTAETQLRTMAVERHGVAMTARELERVNGALAEGAAFVRHRRSHLTLLENLTSVLPNEAWIMAIRTDSSGGHLVTLSDRAAGVLAAMDSVSGIGGTALLGPVTREVIGTREVERATIRFRWNDQECALRVPHCAPGEEAQP